MELKNDARLIAILLPVSIIILFNLTYVFTVYVSIRTLIFLEPMSCPKIWSYLHFTALKILFFFSVSSKQPRNVF